MQGWISLARALFQDSRCESKPSLSRNALRQPKIEPLICWRLCPASHPKGVCRRAIVRLSCVATVLYQIRYIEMARTGLQICVASRYENKVLMLCSLKCRHSIKVGVTAHCEKPTDPGSWPPHSQSVPKRDRAGQREGVDSEVTK